MALPLLAGGAGSGLLPLPAGASPARGRPLRSLDWLVPCELTVLNDLERPLKMYWLNYDGDPELFGSLSPGSVFTVHTFESHAWRFVDAGSGATLAEHVAGAGKQVVHLAPRAAAAAAAAAAAPGGDSEATSYTYGTARGGEGGEGGSPQAAGEDVAAAPPGEAAAATQEGDDGPAAVAVADATFEGFDGLGNEAAQYTLAQLREIKVYPGGGTVLLSLPTSPDAPPLEVSLAGSETQSLVAATGTVEQRRPSTLGTWSRSLRAAGVDLQRVCVTRLVDGVYYCRLVIARPDSSLASLDATPGDSLSLALQLGRPIYVSNEVARVHQSVFEIFARRRQAVEAAALAGVLDAEAEAEADRAAREALDSVTRELPSAPRPVRAVQLDRGLDA